MTAEEVFAAYRQRIVGGTVRRRRLAGNSLLVYVDCEPGDGTGLTLWLEPTWHLRDEARVLAGSRQAQHDPDAPDSDAGFNRVAEAIDVLVGRRVHALEMDAVTGDLTVSFEDGLTLCTFVSDPETDELWHIRDNATEVRVQRSGRALTLSESLVQRFARIYAAFNARDVDTLMDAMTRDVDWANGMTGGRVHGRDAVRDYWAAQWAELDPQVTPVRVTKDADGAVVVDVHQVVRDRAGALLMDRMVRHVYQRRGSMIARMDIVEVEGAG